MGRRRKYGRNKSSSTSYSKEKKGLTRKDEKLLLQYLNEYRIKASNYCLIHSDDISSSITSDEDGDKPLVIGGCTFPLLNEESVSKPYLELPKELSSKQRRTIHEFCVYADLFHLGIDGKAGSNERFVAISIYSDGLEYALSDEQKEGPTSLLFLKHKPWVYRGQKERIHAIIKRNEDEIYKLIDQPSICLRDGIDSLDLELLRDDDLSSISVPQHNDGKCLLVDSQAKMLECIQELEDANLTEIAFDLECYNKSKFMQMTCLLQLATSNGKEYVIDTLAPGVWEAVGGLAPLFANPKIVKIGHSIAGLDVKCLERDFGIFIVNAFDTFEAANCLHLKFKGLAKVCEHYGLPSCDIYQQLKEKYQNADWSLRPLDDSMVLYGRYDCCCLILLRRLMIRDLVKQEQSISFIETDRDSIPLSTLFEKLEDDYHDSFDHSKEESVYGTPTNQSTNADNEVTESFEDALMERVDSVESNMGGKSVLDAKALRMKLDLMHVLSRSQESCLKLWRYIEESHLKNTEFQSMIERVKNGELEEWTAAQLACYTKLAKWREELAVQFESMPGFICSLGFLAFVAFKRPRNYHALRRITYFVPDILREERSGDNIYLKQLFQIVIRSCEADGMCHDLKARIHDEDIPCFGRKKGKISTPPHTPTWFSSSVVTGLVGTFVIMAIVVGRQKAR